MPLTNSSGYPLLLHYDDGGYRHQLAGRPVSAGAILEVLTDAGWIPGRYEWTFRTESSPYLVTNNKTGERINLSSDSRLRWPDRRTFLETASYEL